MIYTIYRDEIIQRQLYCINWWICKCSYYNCFLDVIYIDATIRCNRNGFTILTKYDWKQKKKKLKIKCI